MSEKPELGQIVFDNPTGNYGTEEWQDVLIEYLLEEIKRVYWNKNQKDLEDLIDWFNKALKIIRKNDNK
jgi:ABC-type amino acid transport substrate-binding protein